MRSVVSRSSRCRAGFIVSALVGAGMLASCAQAPSGEGGGPTPASSGAFPVTIDNCGQDVTVEKAPEEAITLNQGATEVALALGLEDRLAGTAYLDDQVAQQWRGAYDSVPVLAKEYPSQETFLEAEPDLAYASYASAFDAKSVGTRDELAAQKIPTYLSPFGCPDEKDQPEASFESAWTEIEDVATIFGVKDRGAQVVQEQEQALDDVRATSTGEGIDVLWYDSNTKTPFVGGGGGGPQLVLDAVGATNIFADLADSSWEEVSWEQVVAADPEVIVLADAAWSTAEEKIEYLENDPVLSELGAVQQTRYVTVPFAASTPGVRLVEGAQTVSEQLAQFEELGK